MIRFECDYSEGAHPKVMEALAQTNLEQTPGYGLDEHCRRAGELIKKECACPDADVHFLVGGTQANFTVISSILRPYQGVLCADTGHISCHESGAVEATGHKVLPMPGKEGRISAGQVRAAYDEHWSDVNHEHTVQPGMVYISYPTEYGTLYSREELAELYRTCRELELPLFIDGARMGYGLAADKAMTLADIARNCDVFYIGGTKVGMLFGEALVIVNDRLKRDFRYMIKQRGGMLAKGRLLGVQFETMLEDGLYYRVSDHAVETARRIREAFERKGIAMLIDSPTNQQFPILSKEQQRTLGEKYSFCHWQRVDDESDAVRFCTSWATAWEHVDSLVRDIESL